MRRIGHCRRRRPAIRPPGDDQCVWLNRWSSSPARRRSCWLPNPPTPAAALRSPQATFDFAGGTTLNASLFIALESFAHSRADGGSARADFSSSFGFPTGTDVFDLPVGYTANAGDYLVNNRFIDPNGVGAVPEPTTWAMLILGFGIAGAATRMRSHRIRMSFKG